MHSLEIKWKRINGKCFEKLYENGNQSREREKKTLNPTQAHFNIHHRKMMKWIDEIAADYVTYVCVWSVQFNIHNPIVVWLLCCPSCRHCSRRHICRRRRRCRPCRCCCCCSWLYCCCFCCCWSNSNSRHPQVFICRIKSNISYPKNIEKYLNNIWVWHLVCATHTHTHHVRFMVTIVRVSEPNVECCEQNWIAFSTCSFWLIVIVVMTMHKCNANGFGGLLGVCVCGWYI